ncbi:MAG TPA: SpoIID/LytB domain-containing protein [Acidimicrobiales bacterium]|nr:SpoIID/LytB domain-containing protein [Acidimicrobiales bacterium]
MTRAVAASALMAALVPMAAHAAAPVPPGLIPALQIDGKGHGHGVGMAQDGALAMGHKGANVKQILGQFYPGTSLGKASGSVRVPVFTGDNVEVSFPDGGDVRGNNGSVHVAAGGSVVLARDGDGTKVKAPTTTTPAPPPTSTTSTVAPTTTTGSTTTTTPSTPTTLLPDRSHKRDIAAGGLSPTTAPAPTTTTSAPPPTAPTFSGTVVAVPTDGGRVGVVPRGRRYRGELDVTPITGGLRFVNQVNVETYLRGMGEVRNPSWPAASLQAQAIAARTYALRAMAAGGELCDSQKCQVYIGSDAEYAAMDKAVAATTGQVLLYGRSLASAVYSANAGGTSADREEGFGMTGGSYPYLRAAPYLTENVDPWSVTIALSDIARRLSYPGNLNAVTVTTRGPSGRATSIGLTGSAGDKAVTGLAFASALGLHSTLFGVKGVMATNVASLTGGSVLQAPPEDAPAIADSTTDVTTPPLPSSPVAVPERVAATVPSSSGVGFFSLVAAALWGAAVVSAFRWRRRSRSSIARLLS